MNTIDNTKNLMVETIKKIKRMRKELPNNVGREAVEYFKESFDKKEFDGDKWEQSVNNFYTLVGTGKLKDAIRYNVLDNGDVEIINDLPYAEIHNEGGIIKTTDKMRKFFWAKYYSTGNVLFRNLALSKQIVIPQREFIGGTKELIDKLTKTIKDYVGTHF